VESSQPQDRALAQEVLLDLLPATGKCFRIGISGVPGVGKSTFIEAFGERLTERGHRVAVLAVDPTSGKSGGSILGDKTRMAKLSRNDSAFIRPSPSGGSLGGVASKTRESMLVCEAAGFDVMLVETVGVGQSETTVAEMVDCFLLLMLPGAGDELQGIKRGIVELADVIAINKADQDPSAARRAKREYLSALKLMRSSDGDAEHWTVPVVTVSAVRGDGIDELITTLWTHRDTMEASGRLEQRRVEQRLRWMWRMVEERTLTALREHPEVARLSPSVERELLEGKLTPALGADALLRAFGVLRD
jgi:LAO/AO transport system kinase